MKKNIIIAIVILSACLIGTYIHYDNERKAEEQRRDLEEAIKSMNNSYNSLNKDVYEYAAGKHNSSN